MYPNINQQPAPGQAPDVVVWVDEGHAIVAKAEADGISTVEVRRFGQPEHRFLGRIVHEIGDGERVMIVGAQPLKLGLERAYVAFARRPDRLIPAPPAARGAESEILDRFERLAA